MIKYEDVFNKYTLNIFTDASITKVNGETIGCPGYIAVIKNREEIPFETHTNSQILRNTTNNECELYAIRMAIQEAISMKDKFKIINIFSDSQFAVYGLREWMFEWITNMHGGRIHNSSCKPVANQDIFNAIVSDIIEHDLCVNIYHNRGHFNSGRVSELTKFIELFTKHNFLNDYINEELAFEIIKYNDKIDNFTRDRLKVPNALCIMNKPFVLPEYDARNDLDLNHYKELLNI